MSVPGCHDSARAQLLQFDVVYREFEAERQEILKHKWVLSERAGRDVGFEAALLDWVMKHRAGWRRGRRTRVE